MQLQNVMWVPEFKNDLSIASMIEKLIYSEIW